MKIKVVRLLHPSQVFKLLGSFIANMWKSGALRKTSRDKTSNQPRCIYNGGGRGWFAAFKHHCKLGQLQSDEVNTIQRLLRHVIIFSIYPNTSSFLLEEIMWLHSMYLHRVSFENPTIGIMKYQINLNSSL